LGVTQEEESRIRDLLGKQALSAEEIERTEAQIALRERLPEELSIRSLSEFSKQRNLADGQLCAGDINCASRHCNQAGLCRPLSEYKANGLACDQGWECQSNRCSASLCTASKATDKNGVKDTLVGETGVDCGGATSPYACPVGDSCKTDDDCVAGSCVSSVCVLVKKVPVTDSGRVWKASNTTSVTAYPFSSKLKAEADPLKQQSLVSGAPKLYSSAALTAAEFTRSYQHDACMAHFIASGCSTVSVQLRTHRAAYDHVICPSSARAAVGIAKFENTMLPGPKRYGTELSRGDKTLSQDPYLCNHSFTRGVRYLTRTANPTLTRTTTYELSSSTRYLSEPAKFTGLVPAELGLATTAVKDDAREWFAELEMYMLVNAACTRGRATLGSTRQGTDPAWTNGSTTDSRIKALCDRYTPWGVNGANTVTTISSGSLFGGTGSSSTGDITGGTTGTVSRSYARFGLPSMASLTADEIAFIKANVTWYNAYDIYSIDPEGNPYLPANENMQYGWDFSHSAFNFGSYALDWGLTLVPTTQSYTFSGTSYSVWGTTSTSDFGWSL
jgi:hypothetical protein